MVAMSAAVSSFFVVSIDCGMDGLAGPLHDGVEPVLVVGFVVDFPEGAVGLLEGVVPLDFVAFPGLVLALDVVCMRVVDFVFELVVGSSLGQERLR